MSTVARTAPPVKPGKVRLVRSPIAPCDLIPEGIPGEVVINGVPYAIAYNAILPVEGDVVLFGYELRKADGTAYDLPMSLDSCDCPDHIYRREPAGQQGQLCKHARALTALRNARRLV